MIGLRSSCRGPRSALGARHPGAPARHGAVPPGAGGRGNLPLRPDYQPPNPVTGVQITRIARASPLPHRPGSRHRARRRRKQYQTHLWPVAGRCSRERDVRVRYPARWGTDRGAHCVCGRDRALLQRPPLRVHPPAPARIRAGAADRSGRSAAIFRVRIITVDITRPLIPPTFPVPAALPGFVGRRPTLGTALAEAVRNQIRQAILAVLLRQPGVRRLGEVRRPSHRAHGRVLREVVAEPVDARNAAITARSSRCRWRLSPCYPTGRQTS